MREFKKFPKIDAHFHSTYLNDNYYTIAKRYNLRYININTNATDVFPPIEEQERIALDYERKYPKYFNHLCTFSMDNWDRCGWIENVKQNIIHSMGKGALGVKIWKNIGMKIRKSNGEFLMIDDEFFSPIFNFLSEQKIPVLAHLGEPLNCWLPLDKMTSERNKTYFSNHPDFHAYLYPEIPSYEKQIKARDQILQLYPDLVFIGAHLGSMEWSYEEIAKRLDIYPNFSVDLSSRIGHLQLQSITDYDGVRNFLIKYAERIIYGTDAYNNLNKLETSILDEWEFLATNNICFSNEVNKTCRGLSLPEDVLYQIYYENAKKRYNMP